MSIIPYFLKTVLFVFVKFSMTYLRSLFPGINEEIL